MIKERMVQCRVCKSLFATTSKRKVYCGADCRQKKWRENHKKFDSERKMKWARDNRERFNGICKKSREKLKREVLTHYSKGKLKCACCGEKTYEFLVIDHINGGGNAHRRSISRGNVSAYSVYSWLRKNNYPEGFQVLCCNCNMAKSIYGKCPHKK